MAAREAPSFQHRENQPKPKYPRFGSQNPASSWAQDMMPEPDHTRDPTHQERLCMLRASERTPIDKRMAEITAQDLEDKASDHREASPRPKQTFLGPGFQPIPRGQAAREPLGVACVRKNARRDFERYLRLSRLGVPLPKL